MILTISASFSSRSASCPCGRENQGWVGIRKKFAEKKIDEDNEMSCVAELGDHEKDQLVETDSDLQILFSIFFLNIYLIF